MNKYEYTFSAMCPSDGDMVIYALTIETEGMISAEDIRSACQAADEGYQEDIAEDLVARLGGKQTLVATHRGVRITTTRGE